MEVLFSLAGFAFFCLIEKIISLFNSYKTLKKDCNNLKEQNTQLHKELSYYKTYESFFEYCVHKLFKQKKSYKGFINYQVKKLLDDKTRSMPWLAAMIADFELLYMKPEPELSNWQTSYYRNRAKQLRQENKMLEYNLNYFIKMFPAVEDYAELEDETVETTEYSETGFLSKEEYDSLSEHERNVLAFERYKKRHKYKWEIGRDFEMYVAYKFEHEGYKVTYNGIKQKYADMGRDLICENSDSIIIVQCKYWSKEKTIHEKHIFQLFGTFMQFKLTQNANKNIYACFVCHNKLSELARKCAEQLNIDIQENVELGDYPMIKCNLKESIYHLPFDQQYDNFQNKVTYVSTIEAAEKLGCRRAWKWNQNNLC